MIPEQWLKGAVSSYAPGMENASEHDRNGAFHWWLKARPSKAELSKLWQLTLLDPDQVMASDVRRYIKEAENFSAELELQQRNK
ncbi:hypothetical protein MWU49_08715 [Alcanivorax sp. S6407]|uniref:hypothetical protein n=1 Tax=Alcanivorax sp. S6407 TaxID=2926424 RepID=UPI001FF382E8|nr:hypothetical protein [Alcanivorax sp. S6407]MCK0153782.1 hypothetical protein [Alcanivorax sp. S6407]